MVENVKYKVIRKLEILEVREYPEILLATVTERGDDSSFGILFNYISGNNESQKKIPMTAPVVSSEKIAMTAPVISNERFFTFVMPSSFTLETIPKPIDKRINLHVQAYKKFAVLKFGGRTNDKIIARMGKTLIEIIGKYNIEMRGDVFLMRYNSPFMPGIFRRNEIAIEIQ